MKIRTTLLVLFLLLFSALLLIFAVVIYVSSAQNRKQEYFKHLKREAVTKANLLFDAKVPEHVLQLIYKNSANSLFEEEVAIYDTSFKLLYHDAVQIDKVKETKKMIDRIIAEKEITFDQGNLQVIGLVYKHKNKTYIITAAANDKFGLNSLNELKYTLIVSFFIIIGLTIFAGYYFVGKALNPVAKIVNEVEEITATNLYKRVEVKNDKDEIGELATTFNHMLDRLEYSFEEQKNFVSNISHELRTPLATIIGELQLALIKERSANDYKEVIQLSLNDTQRLVKLSNGLLDLAKASYDPTSISRKVLRIDELLMDAREAVLKTNKLYKVDLVFEKEIDQDDDISVKGNEYLLKVAFVNLMENACKFSIDHRCVVTINFDHAHINLVFKDNGIGIAENELQKIFTAFYRGTNKDFTSGNGIGLSLTKKIIGMHLGTIRVESKQQQGSNFILEIPNI